jgi:hypothetical protein
MVRGGTQDLDFSIAFAVVEFEGSWAKIGAALQIVSAIVKTEYRRWNTVTSCSMLSSLFAAMRAARTRSNTTASPLGAEGDTGNRQKCNRESLM